MTALHLLAFPHTRLDGSFTTCAYTEKARKFRRMDWANLTVYGGPGAEVEVIDETERESWFGPHDPNRMPDVGWSPADPWWRLFNARAIIAVAERAEPHDLLLLGTSWAQKPVADAFPELLAVEYGVGYEGITLERCAFESQAWMHHVYGLRGITNGRNYDAVIPNFFDPDDFPRTSGGGDYLLFLGRVTPRKGVQEAIEISAAAGMPLVVAGPSSSGRGAIDEVDLSASHVEYVGPVAAEERAELLAGAHALLAPTRYIEPFGGAAVEAMCCGTPAITTDFGAYTETVPAEFRFRTLADALAAVKRADDVDRDALRARTLERFSLAAIKPLYETWFDRLGGLFGEGWYERRDTLPLTKEAA